MLNNQKGLAPIILIIIFAVVIAGVAGIAYQSRKEIKVRSDKTSETTDLKGSAAPGPNSENVNLDKSGKLADKAVTLRTDNSVEASPQFSITPPAGWDKLPPDRNIVVEFVAPAKDQISEGKYTLDLQPNITVFVMKKEFKDLDEAVRFFDSSKSNEATNSKQKIKINGQEAYSIEKAIDIRDLAQSLLENQLKAQIAEAQKAGQSISYEEVKPDMDKVLQQAKGKVLSYIFYKDGYYINVSGKALDSAWSKREPQIKRSLDTFKFI